MIEQRLEQALANWQQWGIDLPSIPSVLCELNEGLTNNSYLVISGSHQMVLRLNAENSEQLGINRHHEKTILRIVSEAGIAPSVYYCSPEEGVLVTELVEGVPLDIKHPDSIQRIQKLFEQVHQLKPEIPVFDYLEHISNYRQIVGDNSPVPLQLESALSLLQKQSGEGLCHHDPSPGNLLDANGKLYLLDWEYAGLGSLELDKAAIRAEWGGFCTTPVQTPESQRSAESVYKYLCYLWKTVNRSRF